MPERSLAATTAATVLACVWSIASGLAADDHPSITELVRRDGKANAIVLFKVPSPTAGSLGSLAYQQSAAYINSTLGLPESLDKSVTSIGRQGAASVTIDDAALNKLVEDPRVELVAPNRSHPP